MGLAQLAKTTLIMPRSEMNEALKEISKFEWFHPIQPESGEQDKAISDLATRSYKLYLQLNEAVQALGLKYEPSFSETMTKGYRVVRKRVSAKDWVQLIQVVEDDSKPILEEVQRVFEAKAALEKRLSDQLALKAALRVVSEVSLNLAEPMSMKRFRTVFAVAKSKDVEELERSLPSSLILYSALTKNESAVLIADSINESERIDKVLRSFEVKPFTIPRELPQNPAEANRMVEERISDIRESLRRLEESAGELKQRLGEGLLRLTESAKTGYIALERVKKAGDLERFATLSGYIPINRVEDFEELCRGKWLSYVEAVRGDEKEREEAKGPPALLTNTGMIKAFEGITLSKGPPNYGEVDPTPLIAIVFPIFYGFMFSDVGQGLVLALLGFHLRTRGKESLRQWGGLLAAGGMAGAIGGLIVGEVFGLEVEKAVPQLQGLLGFIPRLPVSHFGVEVIQTLLLISIVVGIIHITSGFALDIFNGLRKKEYVELIILKIPTLALYVSGIIFVIALFASGFRFEELFASEASTPLGLTAGRVSIFTAPVIMASTLLIILGRPIAAYTGKLTGESVGAAAIMGVIEFLVRFIEFLANTISYARLAILLLIHAILMAVVNQGWGAGALGLLIVFFGNIGVMALEGLIVYIQALRLHIYEWFIKFYSGSGVLFQKIVPDTLRIKLEWE